MPKLPFKPTRPAKPAPIPDELGDDQADDDAPARSKLGGCALQAAGCSLAAAAIAAALIVVLVVVLVWAVPKMVRGTVREVADELEERGHKYWKWSKEGKRSELNGKKEEASIVPRQ
jgi:hypothetical protein